MMGFSRRAFASEKRRKAVTGAVQPLGGPEIAALAAALLELFGHAAFNHAVAVNGLSEPIFKPARLR